MMEYKRTGNKIVVRLQKGEEVVAQLLALAQKENVTLAEVTGIGATDCVDFGCFNTQKKQYKNIHKDGENFEITALVGNLSEMNGEKYQHLHITLADENGCVYGGHLKSAVISVTAEIVVSCIDAKVDRAYDDAVGANLLQF